MEDKKEIKRKEENLNCVLDKYIETLKEVIDVLKSYKHQGGNQNEKSR